MNKLLKIDELLLPYHSFLSNEDSCYYLMDYRARVGAGFSSANQLIYNFKKPVKYRNSNHWHYKESAINKVQLYFKQALLNRINFETCTLVPIPPSKIKVDPEYDDRMSQVLRSAFGEKNVDFRELICTKENILASHDSNFRPSVTDLFENLYLDPKEMNNLRDNIILFDDMLTTGAHFKACEGIIKSHFPEKNVLGIFIARRDIGQSAIDDFDEF